MRGSWIGLVFAFVFAVAIPQRAIPQFMLHEPVQAIAAGLAIVATTAALILLGRVVGPAPAPRVKIYSAG